MKICLYNWFHSSADKHLKRQQVYSNSVHLQQNTSRVLSCIRIKVTRLQQPRNHNTTLFSKPVANSSGGELNFVYNILDRSNDSLPIYKDGMLTVRKDGAEIPRGCSNYLTHNKLGHQYADTV